MYSIHKFLFYLPVCLQMAGQHAILTDRCATCIPLFRSTGQKGQIQNKRHQGAVEGNGPIEYAQRTSDVSRIDVYYTIAIYFRYRFTAIEADTRVD